MRALTLALIAAVADSEETKPVDPTGMLLIRQFEFGFLGNIMFEYAAALGIAAETSLQLRYVDEHSLLTYSGKNSTRKKASLLEKFFPNLLARKVECDLGEDDMDICAKAKCEADLCRDPGEDYFKNWKSLTGENPNKVSHFNASVLSLDKHGNYLMRGYRQSFR
jgi:hypothetical protein